MNIQPITPYDQQGRLVCHVHNVPAVLRTSHTVDNMNRDFYTCPRRAHEGPDNCRFFYWKDQLPPPPETDPSRPHTPPPVANHPTMQTPSSRIRPVPSYQSPFLPSPNSPTKRGSPFENDKEARRKRLRTIKDALSRSGAADSGDTGTPAMSARALRNSQSNSRVLKAPESPARISPDKDQVMSTPPSTMPKSYKLSGLGLDIDPSRSSATLDDEDDELWRDFTPSSSAEKVANSLLRFQENAKGKRRAVELEPEEDDVRFWQDAPAVATSQGNLFRQGSFSPKESSTATSPVRETSELSGDNIEGFVSSTVNGLSDILDYVRMLERKLAATEKSNAFKANRIKELEAEKQQPKSPRAGWSSRR